MKIKFLYPIQLETSNFPSNTYIYKIGSILEVEHIGVNEEFHTATIFVNENKIFNGVPRDSFEVLDTH